MGADLRLFVERRTPALEVPAVSHAEDPGLLAELERLALAVEAGDVPRARRLLGGMRRRRRWDLVFEPDPASAFVLGRDVLADELHGANLYGYAGGNLTLFGVLAGLGGWRGPRMPGPRGLPEDLSPALESVAAAETEERFAESWLTLAELQAFDWEQGARGRWGRQGTRSLRRVCGQFHDETMTRLEALGEPENVRVVFWFVE